MASATWGGTAPRMRGGERPSLRRWGQVAWSSWRLALGSAAPGGAGCTENVLHASRSPPSLRPLAAAPAGAPSPNRASRPPARRRVPTAARSPMAAAARSTVASARRDGSAAPRHRTSAGRVRPRLRRLRRTDPLRLLPRRYGLWRRGDRQPMRARCLRARHLRPRRGVRREAGRLRRRGPLRGGRRRPVPRRRALWWRGAQPLRPGPRPVHAPHRLPCRCLWPHLRRMRRRPRLRRLRRRPSVQRPARALRRRRAEPGGRRTRRSLYHR